MPGYTPPLFHSQVTAVGSSYKQFFFHLEKKIFSHSGDLVYRTCRIGDCRNYKKKIAPPQFQQRTHTAN